MQDDTGMEMRRDPEAVEKVHAMIADIGVAMLGTYDSQGACHARPMVAIKREEGQDALWFFTRASSRKVREIAADARVCIDYAEPKSQDYVSVTGHAEISRDRGLIERMWSEPMRTWFPDGTDDPDIALLKVEMESAEYWDSPSSAMVFAFGYAKARLTGEPPKPGEVAHVEM